MQSLIPEKVPQKVLAQAKGDDGFLPFISFLALASPAVCTVGGAIYKVLTSPTALSTIDFVVTKLYHWFFK